MKNGSGEFFCHNKSELSEAAKFILSKSKSEKIVFSGPLGSGKTTLIKTMCSLLGVPEDQVTSPSFNILNIYQGITSIYHFDFYRLNKAEEAFALGYEEYFYSDHYVFIEWAEKIEGLVPDFFQKVNIHVINDNCRHITMD